MSSPTPAEKSGAACSVPPAALTANQDQPSSPIYSPPPPPPPPHRTTKKLESVPHTPQMVVKVRDCPASHMPIELCYQCFGDPEAGLPPVLLMCGLNMQMYAWDEEFCEALVRAGFFVIRYDNRDMGHSTKIEHRGRVKVPLLLLPGPAATWLGEKLPYGVEDMAADAWALLDVLGLPCAHLFGISMGGMIAQTAALQAPERTISLTSVMSSTNAPDLPQPQLWVKLWMLRKPPRNCTVEELLEFRVHSLRGLLRSALPPDGDYLKKRFLMSLKRSSYSAGVVRQAATIRRAVGRDAALQRLYVPALVVHGAQDVVVPPVHGYRTATMLPYARMLVLKSMGHYFHPAFFSTIIEAFADLATSTDSTKRRHISRLPSVHSLPLSDSTVATAAVVESRAVPKGVEDGNVAAAAAWRRGGGSVSAYHLDGAKSCGTTPSTLQSADSINSSANATTTNHLVAVLDEQKPHNGASATSGEKENKETEAGEVSLVDATTAMMASMGAFIQPVVADASSPVGMAACRSVMVAVPGGNSNPAVPEAVIVENLFLRPLITAAAAASASSAGAARKQTASNNNNSGSGGGPREMQPAPSSLGRYGASPTTTATASRLIYSPLATATTNTNANATAILPASTAHHGGGGGATPAKSAAAAPPVTDSGRGAKAQPKLLPMEGGVPYVPCSPSRWHEVAPFPQRSTAAGGAGVATFSGGGGAPRSGTSAPLSKQSTAASAGTAYPHFHPQVVGVPLSAYLDTHPMERETSGFALTISTAATRALDASTAERESREVSARESGAGDSQPQQPQHWHPPQHSTNEASWISATAVADAPAGMMLVSVSGGARSPTSLSSSQERRENESFLQLQAPEEVVEATALPSL